MGGGAADFELGAGVVLAGGVGAGAAAGTVAGGVAAGACRSIIEAWLDRIQARTY